MKKSKKGFEDALGGIMAADGEGEEAEASEISPEEEPAAEPALAIQNIRMELDKLEKLV